MKNTNATRKPAGRPATVNPTRKPGRLTKINVKPAKPATKPSKTRTPKVQATTDYKEMDKKELRAAMKEVKLQLKELTCKQNKIQRELDKR